MRFRGLTGRGLARGVNRPVGIAEHFAGQEDKVSAAFRDDAIGLERVSDEADRSSGNDGFAANAFGEGDLVARFERNFNVGDNSS
jgi:hypothetical protein